MRLAAGRALLLTVMLPLLAACDPSGPAEPASADVNVQVQADGDAEIVLLLPADRKRLSPLKLGARVGESLFPKAQTRRVALDDQGGKGFPLVRVRVAPAYSPGSRPRLTFDIGGAVRALSDEGLTSVQVSINTPVVPATARWSVQPDDQSNGYWSWHALRPTQPSPSGEVTLDPRPSRAFTALLLLAITVGSLVAGLFALRARRRWTGVLLGTAAFGASLLTVARAGAVQGDNLGVAGYLSGTTLQVVTLLPLAALLGLPLGITVVALALAGRTPTKTFGAYTSSSTLTTGPGSMASPSTAFTYPEVGATATEMPVGYQHLHASRVVGHGRELFQQCAETVLTWGVQRGSGLTAVPGSRVDVGSVNRIGLGFGPFRTWAPCRVVYVVDVPDRKGFAYGTLPGHPECGEESFIVSIDEEGVVEFVVAAFSRPARWFARLGGPVTGLIQRHVTWRYLEAVHPGRDE